MQRCIPLVTGLILSCLLMGCGASPPPQTGDVVSVEAVIIAPGEIKGGSDAVWRVNVNGYNGPFNIHWDFGGGALVNEHDFSDELSPNLLKVRMLNDSSSEKRYTLTVTVVDKEGARDSREYSYAVGLPGNRPPQIDNAIVSSGRLLVSASDPDGDDVQVSVVDEFGQSLGSHTGLVTEFPVNPLSGFWLNREVELTITANDGEGGITTIVRSYQPQVLNFADNALYAVATRSSASVVEDPLTSGPGSGVLVVVGMGVPDAPFQFMNGVGITCENGSDYVRGTFDAGVPDDVPDIGRADIIDGVWGLMGASELGLRADAGIGGESREPAGPGLGRLDFSILPQGGTELLDSGGILFSFELGFTQPGTYHLGFQAANSVSRTYYQDADQATDHFWGNISNIGIPNTITVE